MEEKKPIPPRDRHYIPKDPDKKKVSGRPLKYDRMVITDEEGVDRIVMTEIDKKRYWYVSFIWEQYERTHFGSIAFKTHKDSMFSYYEVQKLTGKHNISILSWYEFKDVKDYEEFNRKEVNESGMNVFQV